MVRVFVYMIALLLPPGYRQADKIPAGAVKGDFNGDGRQEYVWMLKPQVNAQNTGCAGPCTVKLVFSDPSIRPVVLTNSIGGKITNLGDLNADGRDDIGFQPDWFNGCWRSYFTYTLKNHRWQYLTAPFATHCNQWENNVKPVEKIPGKSGYLKVNYSAFNHKDIVVKTKIVKVN